MNEKCLGWNEIPVKISASNAETANFATDVVNTYNELIHYLYFNLRKVRISRSFLPKLTR